MVCALARDGMVLASKDDTHSLSLGAFHEEALCSTYSCEPMLDY